VHYVREAAIKGEIIERMEQRKQRHLFSSYYVTRIHLRNGKVLSLIPRQVKSLHVGISIAGPGQELNGVGCRRFASESYEYNFDFRAIWGGGYVVGGHFSTSSDNPSLMSRILDSDRGQYGQLTKTDFYCECVPLRIDDESGKSIELATPVERNDSIEYMRIQIVLFPDKLTLPMYKLERAAQGRILPGFYVTLDKS
jgi:hypothetical protein